MRTENWHVDFNPSKFLSKVNLDQLIERNTVYNGSATHNANAPCILCGNANNASGIVLNEGSFLCDKCYLDVASISYPEKYETLRRKYLIDSEARKLAKVEFSKAFEYTRESNGILLAGWLSLPLMFVHPSLLVVSAILIIAGYYRNSIISKKLEEWRSMEREWERLNPQPREPLLRHFHDPMAELSRRDQMIMKIFDHWPGYPPYWKYLRLVVLDKDSHRCQVTGCPSRLELHIHHMKPVSMGGAHSPNNLVSLCDFHHALEPEKGHERIWADIKTRYFTLVCEHERSNRASQGIHKVQAHLRRLKLITLEELRDLTKTYGFCCPNCGETKIKFSLYSEKNLISVECPTCQKVSEGPQQLTEETGPRLAEILGVSRNKGRWHARWEVLSDRKKTPWGEWSAATVTKKREQHKEKLKTFHDAPACPNCGARMKLIKPRPSDRWKPFWGCSNYQMSGCKGSARYEP